MAAYRLLAGLLASRAISDVRRGGREVGYAMVRRAPALLEELRDTIERSEADGPVAARGADPPVATTVSEVDADFARGYRAALADALAGFAAALDSRLEVEAAAAALGRRE